MPTVAPYLHIYARFSGDLARTKGKRKEQRDRKEGALKRRGWFYALLASPSRLPCYGMSLNNLTIPLPLIPARILALPGIFVLPKRGISFLPIVSGLSFFSFFKSRSMLSRTAPTYTEATTRWSWERLYLDFESRSESAQARLRRGLNIRSARN